MTLEASLFRLEGLEQLRPKYQLYTIRGLGLVGSASYHQKVTELVRRLSFTKKAPFVSLKRDGTYFLAVPEAIEDIEPAYQVVGGFVNLSKSDEVLTLDFSSPIDEQEALRIRFLDFALQRPLYLNGELWQPGIGKPFFFKKPYITGDEVNIFEGVSIRACRHPDGGFGIICDAQSKLVNAKPIGSLVDANVLQKLVGRSCLYKMNDTWYQFRIDDAADIKVGEHCIFENGNSVSLLQHLVRAAGNAAPQRVVNLDPEGSVLTYFTSSDEQRFAPTALCYLLEDSEGRNGKRLQRETILKPEDRRSRIQRFVTRYLANFAVGNIDLRVDGQMYRFENPLLEVPRLLFGNDAVLSRKKDRSRFQSIKDYSNARRSMMLDRNKGFYRQGALDPQTILIPQSVQSSFGPAFVADFKQTLRSFYPSGNYDPIVATFDDTGFGRSLEGQWKGLLAAAQSGEIEAGEVLVMLNNVPGPQRTQDQLAAMVCNEFFNRFDMRVQVIHSDTPRRGYKRIVKDGAAPRYEKQHGRVAIDGYLKGAALNKVCLGNGRWPFVLDEPLSADLTIGVDVKNNTSVFTLVGDGGRIIRVRRDKSKQKEKLLPEQVKQAILAVVREEFKHLSLPVKRVAVHRDGRVWPEEIAGIEQAFAELAGEGRVSMDVTVSVFEILKTSPAPMRMFNVGQPNKGNQSGIYNPFVGSWLKLSDDDAYLCTTGAPLLMQGTADPLHVRRISGEMSLVDGISDVFSLSCLTWPKPDSCMRDPISIKMCDITLFDEAAKYDMDAVRFAQSDADEAVG
ncbi:hypothetical protein [Sulfitobacter sp. CW3]|uniref:hypothetical protein n=1 Tax=Sulfitobacter sp. CW3 TaxID=2861965 RepID=UPI001C5ED05D|nr:hypothetical protein [Sulfitobacter sp. CW3]MBW4963852.1 hypothetical protein [Sulfitobacter sp. CW3]|tara:strand:+ start:1135 stop:3504 length:2370 start_codon:yes stop_codon:yes gene_type:complete